MVNQTVAELKAILRVLRLIHVILWLRALLDRLPPALSLMGPT